MPYSSGTSQGHLAILLCIYWAQGQLLQVNDGATKHPDEKMDLLTSVFNYQKGSLPFTYLGLPLGTTKPNLHDFLPLMQKVEKRLSCISSFLSQAGKLDMVNSVFSSSAIYYT
jgi:hypothetical protein